METASESEPETEIERTTVRQFLSSSWFAEDDAMPLVRRLLALPCDAEERARLIAYGREEDVHAQLIGDFFARRGLTLGQPFWIQRIFHLARTRPLLLLQFYNVELLAGSFYGAMAGRIRDGEAKALVRRLLRDEAKHIRLHRELLAREYARLGWPARLKLRAWALVFRVGMIATAHVQARFLAPVLGEIAPTVPRRLAAQLRSDADRIFGAREPGQGRLPLPAI